MPPVAGDQVVGGGGRRARQDVIIGATSLESPRQLRLYRQGCGHSQCPNGLSRSSLVPTEFALKNPLHFTKDEVREEQLDPPPQRQLKDQALIARKVQT